MTAGDGAPKAKHQRENGKDTHNIAEQGSRENSTFETEQDERIGERRKRM